MIRTKFKERKLLSNIAYRFLDYLLKDEDVDLGVPTFVAQYFEIARPTLMHYLFTNNCVREYLKLPWSRSNEPN